MTANLGEGWSDASCTLGKDHRVRVNGSSESSWTSDDSWLVQDLWSADIDGDGMKELILLVWKQGSFGRHKPFWVKEDERTFSQHIFVIEVREGRMVSVWMSSKFPVEVERLEADGSRLTIWSPDGAETSWVWDTWGYMLAG